MEICSIRLVQMNIEVTKDYKWTARVVASLYYLLHLTLFDLTFWNYLFRLLWFHLVSLVKTFFLTPNLKTKTNTEC